MGFIVFGAILLVMTLVAGKFMAKEPENPNCGADVADVKNNKILYKVCVIISSAMIAAGLLIELF